MQFINTMINAIYKYNDKFKYKFMNTIIDLHVCGSCKKSN